MDFDQILDAAEAAPVPSRTVRVCVNPAIAEERARLLAELESAKNAEAVAAASDPRLGVDGPVDTSRSDAAEKAFREHESQVQKSLVTLKFKRIDGEKWTSITRAHPMRVDVDLDRHYGYNLDAASKHAARVSGVRVDGDDEVPLTDTQWDRLFGCLAGHDFGQIVDTIWTLNEWAPAQHIEALVKSSGAA